ncbi:hypothetical protein FRC19_008612 [Serendipita sp. 401]|nr:hypothetical protein FRC19_008612 [Serendipita sp. 401]KAG9057216.1 hypothetical protein FS842_008236 [Serendipita sp. 407]
MSSNVNRSISSSRGRGRGAARGRAGRGRGRGRPHSMSLSSKEEDNHSTESVVATAYDQFNPASRRRPSRGTATNVGAPVPSDDTAAFEPITSTGRTREKELPPHIAGTAVDAQTLASRVQELAISGHAHSSSVESRFTMSLNWADEEDDPDSLPSLDDWKVSKPIIASGEEETTEPVSSADNTDESPIVHELGNDAPPSQAGTLALANEEDATSSLETAPDVPQQSSDILPRQGGSGGGMAASIWAPKSPIDTMPKKSDQQRLPNSRGRANHNHGTHRTPPHHHCITPETPNDTKEAQPVGTTIRNRRPHARPIISSGALAQISRTLGQRATT